MQELLIRFRGGDKNLDSLTEAFDKLTLISVHDTLSNKNNHVNQLSFVIMDKKDEEDALKFFETFKEKYNKKLNYKFKEGFCYFSLEDNL